jgi:hypothetical protein
MQTKLKKGYHQFKIDDEPGNLTVTSKLSKKEFTDKLKNNRIKPYVSVINHKGAISNNIFNPYN